MTTSTHTTPTGPQQPRYQHVTVQLTGNDGNVYAIIATVANALRRQISAAAATEFTDAAFACGSYDEVLQLVIRTVDAA